MVSGWRHGVISDIIDIESGVSVNGYDRLPMPDEKSVLKVSAVTYGRFNPNAAKPIKAEDLGRAKCSPKRDRVLMSRSNTPSMVGASAYVDRDYDNVFLSDKLWQLSPRNNEEVSMRWLAYYLAMPITRRRLASYATGTSASMFNISQSDFLRMPIAIPPKPIQEAIENILDKWDRLIDKTEQLIAAKENLLQANISKTITKNGGIRTQIRSLAREVSVRNRSGKHDLVLSVTNKNGFVLPEDQFERRVASEDVSNYKIVKLGQYAYNPSRINVGSIARLDNWDHGILSPMYVVFGLDKSKVDSDYFLYWLKSREAKQRIRLAAQGSVRETVSFGDFCAIEIPLPDIEHQREIADLLNLMTKEIDLLKQLAEKYRVQKRGLMQKLLTGEWRVATMAEKARN